MQITIQIISVDITTKPTKTGSYQQATVAFRDTQYNKIKDKKIMSFTPEGNAIFKIAADAKKDQLYNVDLEKEGEYWVWKSMVQHAPETAAQQQSQGNAGKAQGAGQITGARTYETAEERAERQVLIVRQSSLSAAVATLTAGAKTPPAHDDVVALASAYTEFVFQKEAKESFLTTDFEDIPNDL